MGFTFKYFRIDDSRSAMKVGTDAMLLGAWAEVPVDTRLVVDMGSGSGVISLMIAQRAPKACVVAVEIDAEAHAEALENFAASPWASRVSAVCRDAMHYCPEAPIDLIVSNPPYFSEDLRSPDAARAMARHCGSLSPQSVLEYAGRNLSTNGSVALITPDCAERSVMLSAELAGLHLHRLCRAFQREGTAKSRILWQFGRKSYPPEISVLNVRDSGNYYTEEYLDLTREYYQRPPKS